MKSIKSDMAGTILEVKVAKGTGIKKGQEVLIMESMKMEVPVTSPFDGVVSQVLKQVGDFVNDGETLLELS